MTIEALSLPPREAIAFLLQKGSVGTRRWDDVWKAGHTRAFMVAGVQAGDLLEGVRRAVQRGIAEGTTLAAFRADLQPLLERLGWAARGEGYVGWRTRLVYETNLRSAYAAGDYEQRTEPEVLEAFPYWRYRHSGARDPRPEHKAWDGLVLRADDPWWQTHHPPNGWGCGCWVEPLTAAELGRLGKPGPDSAPPIVTRVWTDRASGRTERVPVGIDPGWDYNVGAAWRQVRDLPPGTLPPDWPPPAPAHAAIVPRQPAPPPAPPPADVWRFVSEPSGEIPVGTVPSAVARALGAATREVRFSAESAQKNRLHHPELTEQDYARLVQVVARPAVMLAQDERRVLLLRSFGVLYVAAVKATSDRGALYLLSFRRAREKDERRLTRRFPELDREE